MAIWMRRPAAIDVGGIGSDTIVLRAAELGALVRVDEAFVAADEAYEHALERAQAQTARLRSDAHSASGLILEKAREQAADLRKQATDEFNGARQQGYADGQASALAEWLEQAAHMDDISANGLGKLRQRIAGLVADTLAQTLTAVDRESLFARALDNVDNLLDGSNTLRLVVAVEDEQAATQAAAIAERRWRDNGLRSSIRVVAQPEAVPGHCRCESDLGIVDASLSTLTRALQDAIVTVVTRAPQS